MKYIFLDIDGVLNFQGCELFCEVSNSYFSQKCIDNLNKIIESTDAEIILISSWKDTCSLKTIKDTFNSLGIIKEIKDCTISLYKNLNDIYMRLKTFSRNIEILEYIAENINYKTDKYVVLDDALLDVKNHIKTSFHGSGLTEKHVDEAIKILNGEVNV